MRTRVSKAFTLVEILIVVVILGILAAIVIPQFTSASEEAQVGNIQTQLSTIRGQIELFRVRNNGRAPNLDSNNTPFYELLCGRGNTHGLPETNLDDVEQEPYLKKAPVNPRNKLDTVSVEDSAEAARDAAAAGDAVSLAVGWFYDPNSGSIYAAGFDESTGKWVVPE